MVSDGRTRQMTLAIKHNRAVTNHVATYIVVRMTTIDTSYKERGAFLEVKGAFNKFVQ